MPIDVEAEIQILRQIVSKLGAEKINVAIMLGRNTLISLTKRDLKGVGIKIIEGHTTQENLIREMANYHVVHLMGHSAFQRGGDGRPFLYLENEDGGWKGVTGDALYHIVAALHPRPHLIFLASCDTAGGLRYGHLFVGIGPKLVQGGISAVVAMQGKITMETIRQLTLDFYQQLLDHGLVDVALNQARSLLYAKKRQDWDIPVVFVRLEDGRLFL